MIIYDSVYSTLSREEAMSTSLSLDTVDAGIVHEEFQKIFLPANLGRIPNNVYVIPHGARPRLLKTSPTFEKRRDKPDTKVRKSSWCIGWWNETSGSKT